MAISDRRRPEGGESSGLAAGISIVAAILLGAALGLGIGTLVGAPVLLALLGGAAGIVLGFYNVYIRWIR